MTKALTYEEMKAHTAEEKAFITIYKACGGWQSQLLMVFEEDFGDGDIVRMYEPWQTGFGPYNKREMAIVDAKSWAEAEEIPYYIPEEEQAT